MSPSAYEYSNEARLADILELDALLDSAEGLEALLKLFHRLFA